MKKFYPRAVIKAVVSFLRTHYLTHGQLPTIKQVPVELHEPMADLVDSFDGFILEWEVYKHLESLGLPVRYDLDADIDERTDLFLHGARVQISSYDKGQHEPGMHYLVLPGFEFELTKEHKRDIKAFVYILECKLGIRQPVVVEATSSAVEAGPVETRPRRKRGPRKNGKCITYTIDQLQAAK